MPNEILYIPPVSGLAIGNPVVGSTINHMLHVDSLGDLADNFLTISTGGQGSIAWNNTTIIGAAGSVTFTIPNHSGTGAVTNLQQSWTAGQAGAFSSLTDGATITPDFSLANNFDVILGGSRTLGLPINVNPGQTGVMNFYQDGTGSRTLTFAWAYQFVNGVPPVLTTAKYSVDQLVYCVNYYEANGLNSISIASPCVITYNTHKLKIGQRIQITTTGTLPTGLNPSTTYWVTPIDANTFNVSSSFANCQAGTFINTTGSQSGLPSFIAASITITANLNLQ